MQSWNKCRYSIGNLDYDIEEIMRHPEFRLKRMLVSETEENILLKKNKIHKFYSCLNPDMIGLNVYIREGIPNIEGRFTPAATLFVLDITDLMGPFDIFGRDRYEMDRIIEYGLRMCTNCRYFEIDSSGK